MLCLGWTRLPNRYLPAGSQHVVEAPSDRRAIRERVGERLRHPGG